MSLQDDLQKLLQNGARSRGVYQAPKQREAIPAARGDADYSSGAGGGGGPVPPFTEQAGARTYYPERSYTSSDGIFVIVASPVRTKTYKDSENTVVKFTEVDE